MKKGVVSETLLYVAGGIIAALAIYYGVSSVVQINQKGEEASVNLLKNTITADLGRISTLYGSNRTFSYNLAPHTQICFLDTKKSSSIINDPSSPEVIRQSISAGENFSSNVYLIGPQTDSFYAGEITVCTTNFKCFNATQGIAKVNVYGGGGYALFNPCEAQKISVPVVINWTVPKEERLELYPEDFNPPKTMNLMANVTDSGGNKIVNIKWMITNVSDGKTATIADYNPDATSLISKFSDYAAFTVKNYSKYYITIVATNNLSKQGSFIFTREFVPPGMHYPYAQIVFPNTSIVPANTNIDFSGIANDADAGYLDYFWEFGDGSAAVSADIFHAANEAVATPNETHSYSINAVSRLVKFKVTNQLGLSAVDTKLISIGNTVPSINITFPVMFQILSASSNTISVNFNFTPSDIEQTTLNCDININGTRIPVNDLPSGVPFNYSYNLAAPQPGLLPIEYYWSVTCRDGIGVNSSPTVRFTVIREVLQNTPPNIRLDWPANGAVIEFKPRENAYFENRVRLSFTPVDNEQTEMFCGVEVSGDHIGLGDLKSGGWVYNSSYHNQDFGFNSPLYPYSFETTGSPVQAVSNAPQAYNNTPVNFTMIMGAINLSETFFWNVTCQDSAGLVNTSETRNFTVEYIQPQISCFVGAFCGSSTPLLSLSGLTNAHVSTNIASLYPYRLCCNLTMPGDPVNYLSSPLFYTGYTSDPAAMNQFLTIYNLENSHAAAVMPISSPLKWGWLRTSLKLNVGKYTPGGGSSGNLFNCSISTTCPQDQFCMLTLSSNVAPNYENSHVASCDFPNNYSNRICCGIPQSEFLPGPSP